MGLEPYGGSFPEEENDIRNSWSSSAAIRTLSFSLLYIQLVMGMLAFVVVVTFQYDLALDRDLIYSLLHWPLLQSLQGVSLEE